MEVLGAVNNKFLVCIYEALGTALLLIALNMSGPDGGTDAQAVASSIFIGIVIFGPISGGHFNPAVTIAVWIKEAINSSQTMSQSQRSLFAGMIIVFQLIGAQIGFFFSFLVLKNHDGFASELILCPPVTEYTDNEQIVKCN